MGQITSQSNQIAFLSCRESVGTCYTFAMLIWPVPRPWCGPKFRITNIRGFLGFPPFMERPVCILPPWVVDHRFANHGKWSGLWADSVYTKLGAKAPGLAPWWFQGHKRVLFFCWNHIEITLVGLHTLVQIPILCSYDSWGCVHHASSVENHHPTIWLKKNPTNQLAYPLFDRVF